MSFVFVLEDGGWNVGLHLVCRFQRRRGKSGTRFTTALPREPSGGGKRQGTPLNQRQRDERGWRSGRPGSRSCSYPGVGSPALAYLRVAVVARACCACMSVSEGLSLLFLHFTVRAVGAECQPRAQRL